MQLPVNKIVASVFWGVLMFSNWKNVVGLARSPVGLTGCRPYERENIEMTVRGRGTALCVVSGVVQESNLFSPRQWTSTNPNERQEFVSYNILVNPLSFERSRIQAHTVMSMNNFTMKSTEHKGGLNLTTMSAKIGATPVKRGTSVVTRVGVGDTHKLNDRTQCVFRPRCHHGQHGCVGIWYPLSSTLQ